MQPIGRRERDLDHERERHHNMTDDQDDEIGGRIICAMMMEGFATDAAAIRHL
jgi:hypothetical protein